MTNIELFDKVFDLATLDKQQISKIISRLPEYKRGSSMIGHGTSQSSYSLQTMQMISDSPLSRMKQCLAQIDKKYKALQEAYYKIEKKKITIDKLKNKTNADSRLTVQEYKSQIESITISMNNALREIGMFQDMYDGIKKNNNIPDNWNEKDYEKQEISNMVKLCFRLAIQDLSSTGRVSKAFVEYCEQLGIHPQLAETRTRSYLVLIQEKINSSETVTIRDMYEFLDNMAFEFKDSYQDALSRIGLDEIGSELFMAKGVTKPQ
jgi:type I site-specific restriction endonuclease